MSGYPDAYARAVRSSNLTSHPRTLRSDSDVLGAAGLAGKRFPLAMALMRLLAGDNHASREIVDLLAAMAVGKAWRSGIEIARIEARDIASAVLAWERDGICKACGGHGFQLLANAPTLSDQACLTCRGTRRRPFEREFGDTRVELATWLLTELQRETARGATEAMRSLAPRLHLGNEIPQPGPEVLTPT